ncbi:hypothetical protein [Sphingobacterium chungjuense]|uniref:hypothetical protein n=1 Tax=Sphingobacterium chungjuense TaxID=2675553 RepID=UPI00140CFCCE|nr:hypothetical protein [Sphingobacterium chungjuense]
MKEQQQPNDAVRPSLAQVANHPVSYAMVVIVTVFNLVFYYIVDLNKDSRDTERQLNEKMLELQRGLYQQIIQEIRPAVEKVTEAANKVDSAVVAVDSVVQKQKGRPL